MRCFDHPWWREHHHVACRCSIWSFGASAAFCEVCLTILGLALAYVDGHISRVLRKPTWGTCAGLILLAESANRTKKGGQDLLGGLNVRVNRNYFGRQTESFQSKLDLPFLCEIEPSHPIEPFDGIFIRAPVVEKILSPTAGEQMGKPYQKDTVTAPARVPNDTQGSVEIMAVLPGRGRALKEKLALTEVEEGSSVVSLEEEMGNIIAVRQQNVFGTSFHPELTEDSRVHKWWLEQVIAIVADRSNT